MASVTESTWGAWAGEISLSFSAVVVVWMAKVSAVTALEYSVSKVCSALDGELALAGAVAQLLNSGTRSTTRSTRRSIRRAHSGDRRCRLYRLNRLMRDRLNIGRDSRGWRGRGSGDLVRSEGSRGGRFAGAISCALEPEIQDQHHRFFQIREWIDPFQDTATEQVHGTEKTKEEEIRKPYLGGGRCPMSHPGSEWDLRCRRGRGG